MKHWVVFGPLCCLDHPENGLRKSSNEEEQGYDQQCGNDTLLSVDGPLGPVENSVGATISLPLPRLFPPPVVHQFSHTGRRDRSLL